MSDRSYIDLLRNRAFLPFFISNVLTNFGDGLFAVLLVYIALQQGASAVELGVISFCTVLPRGLFGPIGGVFGDRMDKRRLLIIVEIVRTAVVFLVPILFFMGVLGIWLLAAVGFVVASMFSIGMPTARSHIPNLVRKEQLQASNGLIQAVMWPSYFAGAGILTVSLFVMDVQNVFFIVAICFLLSLVMLMFIPGSPVRDDDEIISPRLILQDIKQGYLALSKNHVLHRRVLLYGAFTFFWRGVLNVALPLILIRKLGGQAELYGLLMFVAGCGELISSLLVGKLKMERPILITFCGEIFIGTALLILALGFFLPAPIVAVFVATFMIGIAPSFIEIPILTVIQSELSSQHTAKVISYWSLLGSTGGAFGTLMFGSALELFSVTQVMLVSGVLLVLAGVLFGSWAKRQFRSAELIYKF